MEASQGSKVETNDAGRNKVGEWLAGCQAVKDGLFEAYFIEINEDRSGIMVDLKNVNETEARIRDFFGELYPELFPQDEASVALTVSHARRTTDVYAYPMEHAFSEQGVFGGPVTPLFSDAI